MKKWLLFFLPLLSAGILMQCSTNQNVAKQPAITPAPEGQAVRIMFYNVENFFDTIDNPNTWDEQFLPDGFYQWDTYKYYAKRNKLAKVILNTGSWQIPAIIGMCEVENRTVLEDLVSAPLLRKFDFGIVHEQSPDERGIDVALLYQKALFQPFHHEALTVRFQQDTSDRTRDILYVAGTLGPDTLHLFVNHWPSRRGGVEASAPKRMRAAGVLKERVNTILAKNPEAKIIIMGDLNDGPQNRSVSEVLGAMNDSTAFNDTAQLYDYMNYFLKKGEGTHKYKNEWNTLDHIIVSSGLLKATSGFSAHFQSVEIIREDYLIEADPYNPGSRPFRMMLGPKYHGGYSDHLPVVLTLEYQTEQ